MNLGPIASSASRPPKNEEELKQALLQLLACLKQHPDSPLAQVLDKKNWITLTIEAEGLEDSTRIKHIVQFVYGTNQQELSSTLNSDEVKRRTKRLR